jgi:hypothetical protein
MSMFVAGITGFLRERNIMAGEEAAARAKAAEAEAERKKDAMKLVATLVADKDFIESGGMKTKYFQQNLTAAGYKTEDFTGIANQMADVAAVEDYGGFKLPLVSEMKYGSGFDNYDRAQVFWDSWEKTLSNPTKRNEAVAFFNQNKTAREKLASAVRKNEYELRIGNIGRQKAKGIDVSGIQYIDLPQQYSSAATFFDEIGFKAVSEETDTAIAEQIIDFDPETEVAVLMNTRQTGGARQPVPVGVDKDTYQLWGEMASNAGYKSVQEMLTDFSIDADFRQPDETNEQFALRQNDLLTKAAVLHGEGVGDFLANPARQDEAKSKEFLNRIASMTGNDREQQIQIMSMLIKTPANVFQKTRPFRYGSAASQRVKPVLTNSQFVERVTGLKTNDFNDGFAAQEDAVAYLDRLQELEERLGEQVGTGWIREFSSFAKSFGIQLGQGRTTLSNVFSTNTDFSQTDADTTQSDLQAVILKVNPAINLADISESDALKLTLAAKMARAIDPAGRLSNQDFEIQLRRLGDGAFDTPQTIARKLATVRKDFEKDLAYKRRLKAVIDDQTELTPQVARTIQASLRIRNIEKNAFGIKGRDAIVGQNTGVEAGNKEGNLEGFSIVPEYQTKDGGAVYFSDGVLKDEAGNVIQFGIDTVEVPTEKAQ